MRRWREGASGAFKLGVEHGLLCVGCCWALMLLLFAGGVMNLAVIGAVTAIVLVEKVASFGIRTVRITGVMLIALGLWVTLSMTALRVSARSRSRLSPGAVRDR